MSDFASAFRFCLIWGFASVTAVMVMAFTLAFVADVYNFAAVRFKRRREMEKWQRKTEQNERD